MIVTDRQTACPTDVLVHQLVEAQAARSPDALALVFDGARAPGASLTYGELNRRANQLAHHLQASGIGPDGLVAVCMERSLELVIAQLAILKAGGAYVPLDPAYPSERLAFMLEDTQTAVLLTQSHLAAALPRHLGQVLCVDTLSGAVARESEQNPASRARPDNLAYVIYTSGSTGLPKGVQVEHHSLLNLVHWHRRTFAVSSADRATLVVGPAFDASVSELWPFLTAGACLFIPDDATRVSPHLLRDWLVRRAITVGFLPTPLAESVLTLDWPAAIPLRLLLTGGDKLLRYPPATLPFALVNIYGPAESTVATTSGTISPLPAGEQRDAPPDIGQPIDNIQVHLLDSDLQPVASGLPGELYIGGDGLARGYLRRPELTAERFIANPLPGAPGARLYRTGDLARALPNGTLQFLGRLDQQVKIRGHRIELGEIEVALSQHPALQAAVVVARDDDRGQTRLIAYLVPRAPEQTGEPLQDGHAWNLVPQVRTFLKKKLPEPMLPQSYVVLDSLPLSPNGKVDRQALPAPKAAAAEPDAATARAHSAVEMALADVWNDVLGLEGVGIHDQFLDVGGHSLAAAQIVNRLQDALQVDLPLRSLFEGTTIARLASDVEAARCKKAGTERGTLPAAIPPRPPGTPPPLSSAQRQLWLLAQLYPDIAPYNEPIVFDLPGATDVAAIEHGFNEILRRHEALRTNFGVASGAPVQIIRPFVPRPLPVSILPGLSPDERDAAVLRLTKQQVAPLFDLENDPLLRATLVQFDETDTRLLLAAHHIITDRVALYDVFLPELGRFHAAFCAGEPALLPELPIQYADFAAWQQQWLQTEALSPQIAYWKEQLRGHGEAFKLGIERTPPQLRTFHGARQPVALSRSLSDAVRAAAQREGVTLFMTLLSAFAVVLARCAEPGDEPSAAPQDMLVGTVIASRTRPETEKLVGYFLNTLPLRISTAADPTFRELLGQVREVCLGAYANAEVPFERLVEELKPERRPHRNPLFQIAFILDPPAPPLPSGWAVSPLEVDTGTTKFDLTLRLTDGPQGITGSFEYSTELFEAGAMTRMAGHFLTVLAGALAEPGRRLSELPLLTEGELGNLAAWNDTRTDYPADACVHHLFEAQAERSPDAVALAFDGARGGGASLTYRELERRSNQLAHRLRSLGVGRETLVAVCMERSLELVVGLLGILKAGAAYVPLDPTYPKERLAMILGDTRAPVLLTQTHLPGLPLPEPRPHVLCLDADWQAIAAESEARPAHRTAVEDLAYVIYTSGSTGTPKGVQIEHRSLLNLVFWHLRSFAVTASDRATLLSGTAFDASVWELWPYLVAGAAIHLPDEHVRLSPCDLRDWLTSKAITVSFLPTPLAESLMALEWPARCALRTLLTGGDTLHRHPGSHLAFTLVNNYGPTESTVVATSGIVPTGKSAEGFPSIGRAIANTRIYLLDSHRAQVPVGVPGELYIGGDGLARGYLNRPELTAERFVVVSSGELAGQRLYRTGDSARYLPDGSIEFIGRIDRQVKLRGFRIELGEIEAVLCQHPGVEAAAVVVHAGEGDQKRLVAYTVPRAGSEAPQAQQLRAHLRQKLPEHMVPAVYTSLKGLPLTPNGKVDRRALPAPEEPSPELAASFAAPDDDLEKLIAAIWCEVLKLEKVGVDQSFFDIGGHSSRMAQVYTKLKAALTTPMSMVELFQNPTIRALARHLRREPDVEGDRALTRIQDQAKKQREAILRQRQGRPIKRVKNE